MFKQYHDYHLKTSIAKILLHEDGHIFGGYVRDKLLHDLHAQKFYKKYPYTTNGNDDNNLLYQDTSIEPELLGRLVSPNDIDCYMKASSFKNVLNELSLSGLVTHKIFERDPKQYLSNLNIPQGSMKHLRYAITLWSPFKIYKLKNSITNILHDVAAKILSNEIDTFIQNLENKIANDRNLFPKVYLDVFIPVDDNDFNKYEAPFSNLDFECNGLIYTKKGIHMSQSIYTFNCEQNSYFHAIHSPLETCQKFQQILDNINNKNAIVVNTNISKQRIYKMLKKGWTISSNTFTLTSTKLIFDNNEISEHNDNEDCCIICHENFTPFNINPNLGPAYKLYCCEAKYHMNCMVRTCMNTGPAAIQNTKSCIMCRKNTLIDDEKEFMTNVIHEIKALYNAQNTNRPLSIPVPIPLTIENQDTYNINDIFPYLAE